MALDKFRKKLRHVRKKTTYPIGHFYSPIPDPEEAKTAADMAEARRGEIPAGIAINDEAMVSLWRELSPFIAEAPFTSSPGPDNRYYYDNLYYVAGDALVLYALLRHKQPGKFIEIGSGFSSAVALDTRDGFGAPKQITCIEPNPERLLSLLNAGDFENTAILEQKVQDTDLTVFLELKDGDILFVDSSHVMKTGSDLNFIMHEILPRLADGVIIHFHGIFWPFEYPREWIVDQNRAWNELYAIRNFLMYNDVFEIQFFNDYFFQMHGKIVSEGGESFIQLSGGSLWLEKRHN